MKLPFTLGLRGRLFLLLLAVFAALAGVIVWHALDHRDERLRSATAELLAQTRLIAQREEALITRADALLGDLSHQQAHHPHADVAACSRALAERLRQEPDFTQIGWVLPNGDLACAAVLPQTTVNIADREWFQQALTSHSLVVSNITTSSVVPGPIIVIARSLRGASGKVEGVHHVALDLARLRQEVAGLRLPHGGRLAMLDAAGAVVVRHPDPEGWTGRNLAHLPHVKHILAATEPGTLDVMGADNLPRLYAFVPLHHAALGHLHLLLTIPRGTVTAPIYRELAEGVAIMLVVLLAALAFGVWGSHRLMLRPLLAMSRTAQRFSTGDFSARSGLPHGDDEIGRLARTLDETAAAIEDRERRLAYAKRALRVISAGNRTMLRAVDEQTLLDEMCRAIVEAGDYRMAWVGYAEGDKSVRLVAAWGATADFIDGLHITWDETVTGRGPTGAAIRSGVPVMCSNVQTDPDYAPWRERAQRYGYASSLALPLRMDGTVVGALNIYAVESDAFNEDAIELLGESADDLAYGIGTQRAIVEREQAGLKLAEQLDELRRWHAATSGREERILELKHEVNELLRKSGQPPRYPSAEFEAPTKE